MDKIKAICKNREIMLYLVFGVLTTIVNYIVYFTCKKLEANWFVANATAWTVAVIFAYITNRIWVFESKAAGWKNIGREIILFVGCRVLSLGFDMGTMFICLDLCHMDAFKLWGLDAGEFIAKTIAQFIVVVSNYIFSKWIIFRKEDVKKATADSKEQND